MASTPGLGAPLANSLLHAFADGQAGRMSLQAERHGDQQLVTWVRKEIGPIATPDRLQWAPGLPKTRSGKIMRRILRKIAENQPDQLGDTSTLADPAVVERLLEQRVA